MKTDTEQKKTTVGVVTGEDKFSALDDLLERTGFDKVLVAEYESFKEKTGRTRKRDFRIALKPNMMVMISRDPKLFRPVVTDYELVEHLVDRIIALGFPRIAVVESRTNVTKMLNNRNVPFIADRIGYWPNGRYEIVDLSTEIEIYEYEYLDESGESKIWKDTVGSTWRDANFRITFAKCKSHEHDWLTLGLKNVYGCLPHHNKLGRYHIKGEVWDVTARMMRHFPVHFSVIDAWTGSDGPHGYKIASPKELKLLFGGADIVAVDKEVYNRAGLEDTESFFLKATVEQAYGGVFPQYEVSSNTDDSFTDICDWNNLTDDIVEYTNRYEESPIAMGLVNLKAMAYVADTKLFPPKNIIFRFVAWAGPKLYYILRPHKWYRRLIGMPKRLSKK